MDAGTLGGLLSSGMNIWSGWCQARAWHPWHRLINHRKSVQWGRFGWTLIGRGHTYWLCFVKFINCRMFGLVNLYLEPCIHNNALLMTMQSFLPTVEYLFFIIYYTDITYKGKKSLKLKFKYHSFFLITQKDHITLLLHLQSDWQDKHGGVC